MNFRRRGSRTKSHRNRSRQERRSLEGFFYMERLWIGAVLLPLALLAAGCGDSESSLEALGAAEGLYDGVKAANGIYDVAGNRAWERDEAPVAPKAPVPPTPTGGAEERSGLGLSP